MSQLDPVAVTQELVAVDSVTARSNAPSLANYQRLLEQLGFDVLLHDYEDLQGTMKVALEAKRSPATPGTARKPSSTGIGYFCHNDVVSVEGWDCTHGGPFSAAMAEDKLWGRGTCDMKGSAATALAAISALPLAEQRQPIYFFVTGDEECGMAGANLLATRSAFYKEMVAGQTAGVIGEPTELQVVNMHKGGCHMDVSAKGVAAHSSTVEGDNANWKLIPFLSYLSQLKERCLTDAQLRNSAFEPDHLSLNIVVENRPASANITVGEAICRIFFRPMPTTAWEDVSREIESEASQLGLETKTLRPLVPMHTDENSQLVQTALEVTGCPEVNAVCYATDACCFEELENLIVLGPGSIEQAHRPDEWIAIEQLHRGVSVFRGLFEQFVC